jgi:hypothetical protein
MDLGIHRILVLPDIRLAGYPEYMKAGYRIFDNQFGTVSVRISTVKKGRIIRSDTVVRCIPSFYNRSAGYYSTIPSGVEKNWIKY